MDEDSEVLIFGLGIWMIIADLIYRLKMRSSVARKKLTQLMHFENGGQFFFLPVWIWGIVLIVWTVHNTN